MAQQICDLSNIVLKNSENTVFSKFSALQALLYVRNGISDKKLITFYDKLLNNCDIDHFMALNKILSNANDQNSIMIIANSIWIMKNIRINDEYETLMSDFGEINVKKGRANMQKKIDQWVQSKTQNMIMHIELTPNDDLVILNAVYFKNKWMKSFNNNSTYTDTFNINEKQTTNKKFMHIREQCRLFESKDYQLLCKDYRNDFFMVAILHVNNYEPPLLSDDDLSQCIDKCVKHDVKISIPKFEIETEHNLKTMIGSFFKQNMECECDKISDNLIVDQIIQKIIIRVDELGTEAAAITKVGMAKSAYKRAAPQPEPKVFNANKPFSFHIVKKVKNNNVILFSGVLKK